MYDNINLAKCYESYLNTHTLPIGRAVTIQDEGLEGIAIGTVHGNVVLPRRKDINDICINVKGLGFLAIGDGINDDTAAIQKVLNLAKTNGSVSVLIPDGTYKITSRLIVYKNTYIKLSTNAKLLRCHNAGYFINGESTDSFTEYNGNGNITIEGGILEGNIGNFTSGYNAIGLARGKNLIFRNIEIRDMIDAHAFDINACSNVLIDGCRFLGYKYSSEDYNYKESIQIANHTALGFTGFGAFDGTPCKNITVRNCYFGPSGTEGTNAPAVGVGNHSAVHSYHEDDPLQPDMYNRDIKIYNNTFEGCTYTAVRPFKFKDCYIHHNKFIDCASCVTVTNTIGGESESSKDANGVQTSLPQSAININIHHNNFRNTVGDIIYATGWAYLGTVAKIKGLYVEDNYFDVQTNKVKEVGFIKNVSDFVFKNNTINDVGRGLYLAYVDNADISDNIGKNFDLEFIFFNEPDNGTANLPGTSTIAASGLTTKINILNNLITNTLYTGIFLQYVTDFTCSNNKIYSPATYEDNTRNGMTIGNYSKDGIVLNNKVIKAVIGNQNKYGLEITATASNIQESNNILEGKTSPIAVYEANGNYGGQIIYSPSGGKYKVTVSDEGILTIING